MRSVWRHGRAIRDASSPPPRRPAKRIADGLETVRLAAQDDCPVPVMPCNRLWSRTYAYGNPCALKGACTVGGGVGIPSLRCPTPTLPRRRAARFTRAKCSACRTRRGTDQVASKARLHGVDTSHRHLARAESRLPHTNGHVSRVSNTLLRNLSASEPSPAKASIRILDSR